MHPALQTQNLLPQCFKPDHGRNEGSRPKGEKVSAPRHWRPGHGRKPQGRELLKARPGLLEIAVRDEKAPRPAS